MNETLSKKQKLFVEHYLSHFNATRAAIAAGYSRKTARSIGSENLKKPAIADEITRRAGEMTNKLSIEKDRVLHELSILAFASLGDVINPDMTVRPPEEWEPETWRSLGALNVIRAGDGQIVGFRAALAGKDKALEKLWEWHENIKRFKR